MDRGNSAPRPHTVWHARTRQTNPPCHLPGLQAPSASTTAGAAATATTSPAPTPVPSPAACQSVADVASSDPDLSLLVSALGVSGPCVRWHLHRCCSPGSTSRDPLAPFLVAC